MRSSSIFTTALIMFFVAIMHIGCGDSGSTGHNESDTPPLFPGWSGETPK